MFSKFHFKAWNERRADRNKKMAERIAGRRARKSGIGSKEPMVEQHSLLPPRSMRWSLPVVYARSLPDAFEVHAPWMSPSTKASHRRGRGAGWCGSMVASLTARYDISFDISAHRKTFPCLLHAFCIPCAKNRVSMRNIYIHINTYIHTYIHIYIYICTNIDRDLETSDLNSFFRVTLTRRSIWPLRSPTSNNRPLISRYIYLSICMFIWNIEVYIYIYVCVCVCVYTYIYI